MAKKGAKGASVDLTAPVKKVSVKKTANPKSVGGTKDSPWKLSTPSGQSEYQAYRDETLDPPALVVIVGKTELRYHLRCIDDLHAMLKSHGDWMLLGSADEQKPAKEGTVEFWARSPENPVNGWYGLKKGIAWPVCQLCPSRVEAFGPRRSGREAKRQSNACDLRIGSLCGIRWQRYKRLLNSQFVFYTHRGQQWGFRSRA